jgi:hypothetical protein
MSLVLDHENPYEPTSMLSQQACSTLSESAEQDLESEEQEQAISEETTAEIPVVESGSYLYVCSQCGADLTEIPYYNRYYCQNCGLHY